MREQIKRIGPGCAGGSAAYGQFELSVAQGLIPGYSFIDKFGENPDIDTGTTPEDIWEYGGVYPHDATGTAPIVSLVSDSALDTQNIYVQGLDITGAAVNQIITLTGTTRVALTTALWRVYRMVNISDSGNDIDGTIYCYTGIGNVPESGQIRAIIDNGNNQTLMAVYTVPLGKVGFLYRGEVGMSRGVISSAFAARCAYYSRRVGKVFTIKKRVDVLSTGSSNYIDNRSFPDPIPALTDIKATVEEVTANSVGVFGTLDIMLVDENYLSAEFLESIGQPSEMPS